MKSWLSVGLARGVDREDGGKTTGLTAGRNVGRRGGDETCWTRCLGPRLGKLTGRDPGGGNLEICFGAEVFDMSMILTGGPVDRWTNGFWTKSLEHRHTFGTQQQAGST